MTAGSCLGLCQPGIDPQARSRFLARGQQTRSFCYVSDLVEGIYRLMMSDTDMPVNIGNPTEMTVLEFAKEIIRVTGARKQDRLQAPAAGHDPETTPAGHHPRPENSPGLGTHDPAGR